jgi:purine-cytosine permease-like protein
MNESQSQRRVSPVLTAAPVLIALAMAMALLWLKGTAMVIAFVILGAAMVACVAVIGAQVKRRQNSQ